MIVSSIDLEMNQPSKNIIEIGITVGDLMTGDVLHKDGMFIKLPNDETIHPRITKLTSIRDEDLDRNGLDLREAYLLVTHIHRKYDAYRNPIVWGSGNDNDSSHIKDQLERNFDVGMDFDEFCFGRRVLDIKTMFQMQFIANGINPKCGLAKAMTRVGLQFKGKKHRAVDDAYNTFVLTHHAIKNMRGMKWT